MRRLAVLVLGSLAACDGSPAAPTPTPPPSPSEPAFTGIVAGFIRVDSDDIAPLTAPVKGFEKYCGAGPLDTRLYRVAPKSKGLGGAFVEADGRSADFEYWDGVPVLDQRACLFTPDVIVVPPGPVVFKNSDAMAHNVTIRSLLNPAVHEGFPGGQAISRTFRFEEKLVVKCSIHPWMMAGLVVTGRSAHAVTDSAGTFRIEHVEAGRRKITVWHPLGESVSVEVDVPAEGKINIEIPWKPRPGFRAPFGS